MPGVGDWINRGLRKYAARTGFRRAGAVLGRLPSRPPKRGGRPSRGRGIPQREDFSDFRHTAVMQSSSVHPARRSAEVHATTSHATGRVCEPVARFVEETVAYTQQMNDQQG